MSAVNHLSCSARELTGYCLHLADTNLILAQRNAEWCGHGPILEQDIAITNISLDQLGQARHFYQYAATRINSEGGIYPAPGNPGPINAGATEDRLAYLRTERDFLNLLMAELPKGDWARTILRQFFISVYQYQLYAQLQISTDEQLKAIAAKSIREVAYHVKWSSEWVIRLGDGTEESHQRMLTAIEDLWPYTGEFFMPAAYENKAITGIELPSLLQPWLVQVNQVLAEATLPPASMETAPGKKAFMHTGGKQGIHTEHLGYLLATMQYLQRTYPGADW